MERGDIEEKGEGERCGGPCMMHGKCQEGYYCAEDTMEIDNNSNNNMVHNRQRSQDQKVERERHAYVRVNPSALVPEDKSGKIGRNEEQGRERMEKNNIFSSMVGIPAPTGICQRKEELERTWKKNTHMDKEVGEERIEMLGGAESQKKERQNEFFMESFADSNENMFSLFSKIIQGKRPKFVSTKMKKTTTTPMGTTTTIAGKAAQAKGGKLEGVKEAKKSEEKDEEVQKESDSSRSLLEKQDILYQGDQGLIGGLSTVDVEDESVQKAAKAAVKLMVSKGILPEGKIDFSHPHPQTQKEEKREEQIEVKKAYSQVVSGIKYFLEIEVDLSDGKIKGERLFDIVIISQPWMDPEYSLLSVKETGIDEELLH